jgi:hypothetical protein
MLKKILQITKPIRYLIDKITYNKSKYPHKLSRLKGSLKNKPLLIVGNGPSLNKTPLEKFMNINSMGMNKIDLIFPRTSWRPDYVVVSNGLVVKQHLKYFLQSKIPTFFSWKTRWVIPLKYRKNLNFFLEKSSQNFNADFSSGLGTSGTVTNIALQLAYYLEASPIIIVGVDHNFIHSGKPLDYEKVKSFDQNHFDPNYFQKGKYWGIPDLILSEKGYRNAKEAYERSGKEIYDATVDGKLNIFKKISIEEALRIIKKKITVI